MQVIVTDGLNEQGSESSWMGYRMEPYLYKYANEFKINGRSVEARIANYQSHEVHARSLTPGKL